jgi:ribosomal-protein-alanine N-acetyltransferase
MVRLESQRLILLDSSGVKPAMAAGFVSANRPFFEPWSSRVNDEYYTTSFWEKKLEKSRALEAEGTEVAFFVFLKEDLSEIAARVSLTQIARGPFQSCCLGYMTAKKHTRKGIMYEAIQEVINFAFSGLKLHRVEANIMPHNVASVKLVEKLGFNYEGLALKYLLINGVWEDHLHYVTRNIAME